MNTALSMKMSVLFALIVSTQIIGGFALPRTDAFRNLSWTGLCILSYVTSMFLMAQAIKDGIPLSFLMPILAAVIPLMMIGVGVALYGENASWGKLALLTLACGVVGFASTMK